MLKRWLLPSDTDAWEAAAFGRALDVDPLVATLLRRRGMTDASRAGAFLEPKLSGLYDPAGLPGATDAARRILQALRDRQPIVIYGDYDVDGVTASAILWHTLRFAGAEVTTYIPHRLDEGYGLNEQAITDLATLSGRPPLIVSVDCGITAVGPARLARDLGVDLIITDHHTFDPDQLPDAQVLVHPRLTPDAYPFPDLCGAGVAFKLAWEFARLHCGGDRLPVAFRELMIDLLSLVALGTVADVVPLVDENRVLTVHGLGRIKHTRFVGLNAMIDAARLRDEKIGAYHVGFVLGPRLNACGRMGHAKDAVKLLTDATEAEAAELASFLTRENDRRRATERAIFDEARQMIETGGYACEQRRAIVLGKEGWHQGVVGVVASRLVEAYHRPVIMLSYDNGAAHGSARSVDGVSIHEALGACADTLERYGGHAMAAGLTMPTANVDTLRERLVAFINDRLAPEDLTGTIHIDAEVDLDACDVGLFEQIERLAPFGRANRTPVLLARNVRLDRPAQRIGGNGRHVSMLLRGRRRTCRAVGFGMGDLADRLPGGIRIDVAFEPKVSVWQGAPRAELHLADVRSMTDAGMVAG